MKRDVIYANELVIAADNSGSVGEKPGDTVKADYETVGYFSARVALMECLAAGGEPFAAVLQNFAGESAWRELTAGVERAAREAGCTVDITGSTETNFVMGESAVSIVMIGRHLRKMSPFDEKEVCYGVIGKPLVGPEVLAEPESVAPLQLFRQILQVEGLRSIWPVGSKGIAYEMRKLSGNEELQAENIHCSLDVSKSAGPATCFLIAIETDAMEKLKELCNSLYTPLKIKL
ncbi:AIR synthase related protein [Bacillus sp. PK3_68]|uniref:AIR synthase related protein n=1 Tax=Bacillus sp. PK3_68 TaxID=2027408 RepID=UPI000E765E31|nr:AIR synthase related protein [Bacillus sp. PK3_68]RJS61548.1 hypothetical protein CJ483_17090 [Bacillus sp. PK3_68]